jgi:ADP-L-glycero-D-manno-heptose 6-epimerase
MIVVTEAAGFIGSSLIKKLNEEGYTDLVAIDDFSETGKNKSLGGKRFSNRIDQVELPEWIKINQLHIQFVFSLNKSTDLNQLDLNKRIWKSCVEYGLPLVYVRSAAFDEWALEQDQKPYFFAGLKLENIYGPDDYSSIIYQIYKQVKETGEVQLTEEEIAQEAEDFLYVKDVVEILYFLMLNRKNSGKFSVSSGEISTRRELAKYIFGVLNLEPSIRLRTIPKVFLKEKFNNDIKEQELSAIGYHKPFRSLKDGIEDYVNNHLELSTL